MADDNDSPEFVDNFLKHYGKKGMKWGVRNDDSAGTRANDLPGVSRSTNREASKDAQEFARAKMFYGEGAGTRRKLIKASVEAKSKKDPDYKKAFDHHLENQDLSKHASKARKERKRKDTTETVVKTSRGIHRYLEGGFGSVPMASAVIATAYMAARKAGIDKVVSDVARQTVKDMSSDARRRKSAESFLRDSGLGKL